MQTLNHRTLCVFLALAWIGSATAAETTEEEDLALAYGDKSTISIATGSHATYHSRAGSGDRDHCP